jgi:hypothetical protein
MMRWEIRRSRSAGMAVQLRRNTHRAYQLKDDRVRLLSSLYSPKSEAMRVTKKIVESMQREVMNRGSQFSMVFFAYRVDYPALFTS